MTLPRIFIGMPLAFDYPIEHRTNSNSGTRARILSCIQELGKLDPSHGRYSTILFTANKPPDAPDQPVMCEQQRIVADTRRGKIPVLVEPSGWGTASEIRSAIEIVKREFRDRDVTLVVSTNWVHMLRVKLLVAMYKPKTWKCIFVTAKHHFSFWSHLREIPATIITFGRWLLSKNNL